MTTEHEPPRFARVVSSVLRNDGPWCDVIERPLPEHCATHASAPTRRKAGDDPCGGAKYARASKRRACMPYGATERDEERDCPTLLEAYRKSRMRRAVPTSRDDIKRLAGRSLAALDNLDLRPLLAGGWHLVRAAFACWIESAELRAIMDGDPCDREFRRKRAGGSRAPFASVASVLAAADGRATLGMGSITLDRVAESKGRTRAGWGEVECKETRSSSGGVKSLGAIERMVDAAKGLRGAGLTSADARGIVDAAAKLPLEDRLLAYRAELAGWRWVADEKTIARVGEVEARRRAMQEARRDILKATEHISDGEIRKAINRAKEHAENHLRKMPLAGEMALRQGRKELVADGSQFHGLIPARDDRKRKEARL